MTRELFSSKIHLFKLGLSVLALFFLFPGIAQAGHYIVGPDAATSTTWFECEWSNYPDDPTQDPSMDPCHHNTAMAEAKAGDTVYFLDGRYELNNALKPENSGSAGNRIIFRSMHPRQAVLFRDNSPLMISTLEAYDPDYSANPHYVTFDGFTLRNSDRDDLFSPQITLDGKNHVVKNCYFDGHAIDFSKTGYGNHTAFYVPKGTTNSVIKNNYIEGYSGNEVDIHVGGTCIYGGENMEITRNTVVDSNTGIWFKHKVTNSTISKNLIKNTSVVGIHIGDANSNLMDWKNHKVYQNIVVGGERASIRIDNMSDADSNDDGNYDGEPDINYFYDMKVYNNVVYDNRSGIKFEDKYIKDSHIYNNISVKNEKHALMVHDNSDKYSYIDHNLYHEWDFDDDGDNFAYDVETFADWQNAGWGANSLNGIAPQFINPGGPDPQDYKLQPDSPARNAGIDRQDHDNDGDTTENINMGAYITGNETIAYTTPPGIYAPYPDEKTLPRGTTEQTISVRTSESATCRYSTTPGTSYRNMENIFSTTGTTTHEETVTGLQNGHTYNYYVRCKDPEDGDTSLEDHVINFTVAGLIYNLDIQQGRASSTISWQTREPAVTEIEYGPDTSYGNTVTVASSYQTEHSVQLTNLNLGTDYHFRIRAEEESGNTVTGKDHVFFTLSTSTAVIREDCSATSFTPCFESLNSWEENYGGIDFSAKDCEPGDLVCANTKAVAEIRGTWNNPETEAVAIDGWTTSPDKYIKIHTAGNARHNGTWNDNAYRLHIDHNAHGLDIKEFYTRIEGLQLSGPGYSEGINYYQDQTEYNGRIDISHNIVKEFGKGIRIRSGGYHDPVDFNLYNNIVYDSGIGISTEYFNGAKIYNNTAYGNKNGFGTYATRDGIFTNNLSQNNTNSDFPSDPESSSDYNYNISSDDTAPGDNSISSTTVSFQDPANRDFHLTSDSKARDAGADLSSEFTTDIDNQTRSGSWDIGADEYATTTTATCGDGTCASSETPNSCPEDCSPEGDLNRDGQVNSSDFGELVANWFQAPDLDFLDLNGDGRINVRDLGVLMSNW